MPEPTYAAVPFQEAIDYHRSKVNLPTRRWTDIWEGSHSRAFVVAGAMKAELIADLRAAVDKAIAQGTTKAEFRKDFDAIVARHGWSYKGGRDWRTSVIFETNLGQAYSAGKWKQAMETAARRPYGRYIHTTSQHQRPEHAAWHGTVLPLSDAWWSTHWPQNGWRCKCHVETLNDRDLKRYGYEVAKEAPAVEWEERRVRTGDGERLVKVPKGIDPGFAYNPGQAAYGYGEQRMAMERHGPWVPLEAPGGTRPAAPGPLAASKPKASLGPRAKPDDADDLRKVWRDAMGGDAVDLKDPTGERVQLTHAIVDHMLEDPKRLDGREAIFPLLRELVEDPAEIWVGFARNSATGRVGIRRRYVSVVEIGKERVVTLVADLDAGAWSGLTTLPAKPPYLPRLRQGLRVYARGEKKA